jgi:GNAT superfamily N-acetyltransferase
VRVIDAAVAEQLEELYANVLRPAFAQDELEDRWWLDGLDEYAPALVALDVRGRVIGGVTGDWYPEARVLLVGYLAVRADMRGRGIGTLLMDEAERRWLPRFDPLLVLGELEDPRHHVGDDVERRVRFYDRRRAKVLAMPYFQPRLRPTGRRVYHMLLAVFAASHRAYASSRAVDASIVRKFLDVYVVVCEGSDGFSSDDPELRWLRAAVDVEEIALLPLERYRDITDLSPLDSS